MVAVEKDPGLQGTDGFAVIPSLVYKVSRVETPIWISGRVHCDYAKLEEFDQVSNACRLFYINVRKGVTYGGSQNSVSVITMS